MNAPLSVLIVEDSASDAGLMLRQLQKEGFEVFHQRVETAEQMRAALGARAWDAVLSDFKVPGFGAAPALALLHDSGLDLPFIVVSGVVGEEAAVGLMKAGAHDYVMKDRMVRLGAVVRRELVEAGERLGRRQAETALRESAERVSALSRRLIEVQEEEHRQLARELHDEIGQVLTAVRLNLKAIQRQDTQAIHRQSLAEGLTIIERAISQVRGISLRLRPPVLDELGILSALRWLVQRQSSQPGVRISLEAAPEDIALPLGVAEVCYRVAQEALTNVARHSGASEAVVRIEQDGPRVAVSVRDNGRGFDVSSVRRAGGLGLLGMEERVKLIGGTLRVNSQPGAGTEVRAEIELPT